MATRFTRVTIVADRRRLDVSLPAQAPLGEQLPTVLRLLSVPSAGVPIRWRLSAPQFGRLEPSSSLDDLGVLDGTQLYLTEAAAAPMSPIVDDVESAVAEMVAEVAPGWTGAPRRSAVGALLALVLLAGLLVGLTAPLPAGAIVCAAVMLGALVAGRAMPETGGWLSALVAAPAAGGLLLALLAPPSQFPTGGALLAAELSGTLQRSGLLTAMAGAGAVGLVGVGLVRKVSAMTVAATVLAATAGPAVILAWLAVPADRIAALGLVLAVLICALAGATAVGAAGLVEAMVADEAGEAVTRSAVARSTRRGMGVATGMIWAASVIAAAACWVLVDGAWPRSAPASGWAAPAVGVLGGLVFALRSRTFTRVQHIAPMLAAAVTAGAAVALRLPLWCGAGPASGAAISLVLLALAAAGLIAGLGSLPQVSRARLRRALDGLELIAVLALVPGLVVLFDVIATVTRWWS